MIYTPVECASPFPVNCPHRLSKAKHQFMSLLGFLRWRQLGMSDELLISDVLLISDGFSMRPAFAGAASKATSASGGPFVMSNGY